MLNEHDEQKKRAASPRSFSLEGIDPSIALTDPSVPKIYANGFALGMTNADAQVVLQLFGRPVAVVNLSYTLTKTLLEKLSQLVKQWEAKTGKEIQTTDAIDKAFGLAENSPAPAEKQS